jgi:hypothetical protein
VVTYLYYLIFIFVSAAWRIGEILTLAVVFRTVLQHLSPTQPTHLYTPAYQNPNGHELYGGPESAYAIQAQGLQQKPASATGGMQPGGNIFVRSIITLECLISTAGLGLYIAYIVFILIVGSTSILSNSSGYYYYAAYLDVAYFAIYLLCALFFVGASIKIFLNGPSKVVSFWL